MTGLEKAVLATLAYHDIFDYPLTLEEIHKYLIQKKVTIEEVQQALNRVIGQKAEAKEGLYFLRGRSRLSLIRKKRQIASKTKMQKAMFFSKILCLIPTIELIAVSGALAMENSHNKDDIDFVIVSQKGALWTTRFFANILLFPFKRMPNSANISNKACLNLFIDSSDLKLKSANIYMAHELCQMKVLVDMNKTYSKIMKSNRWVTKFLPNWKPEFSQEITKKSSNFPKFKKIESFLKNIQFNYMKHKITTEKIGEKQLFFHPADTESYVLSEFKKRLKNLKINLSFQE